MEITQALPAGFPFLLFPKSKNPGREIMGIFNKSPQNKSLVKLVCKLMIIYKQEKWKMPSG